MNCCPGISKTHNGASWTLNLCLWRLPVIIIASIKKISGHDHRAAIHDATSKSTFAERWPPPAHNYSYLCNPSIELPKEIIYNFVSPLHATMFPGGGS